MQRETKSRIEYGAVRAIGLLVTFLPYRAALAVGWFLARVSFLFMPKRVREAERRIRIVFPEPYTPREVRRIAWISWRNIFFNSIEMMRYHRTTHEWIDSVSDCHPAMEVIQRHLATGKGAVIALPHMGAWDLSSVTCRMHGIPVFNISAMQKNPLIDDYINRLRAEKGIYTVMRGAGTLKSVLKNIGEGQVFAIMPDVRMKTEAIPVPFMGGEANVGAGMASFARHADVPIFPASVLRIGWARHKITFLNPVVSDKSLDKKTDLQKMTAAVLEQFDAVIRRYPEQWFWFNKRWVLDPLDPPAQP